jgi:hypothetical protein
MSSLYRCDLCRDMLQDRVNRFSLLHRFFYGHRSSFDQANPPRRRVERTVALMERRVDIVEIVPN